MGEFIKKAINKHGHKYDYSLVKYVNSKTKIKILCSQHGVFEQTPSNHLLCKIACPKCSLIDRKKFNYLEKFKSVHGDKYDYSLVDYKSTNEKVKIVCIEHGLFEQSPSNHIQGHGCPKCAIKKITKSKGDFVIKANKIHNNKYNYSKVKYINASTKVIIICPIHGEFKQSPNTHISKKSGCVKCDQDKRKLNLKEFIDKANTIHDNKYDYSKSLYTNTRTEIKIICSEHGVFKQTPSNHLQGTGCPRCSESKGENKISQFLEKNEIEFIKQYKFDKCKNERCLPFDFYLPKYNMCIEYDGIQHFKPVEYFGGNDAFKSRKKKDKIKDEYCNKNNIRLVRIRYNQDVNSALFFLFSG